jgi:hypothetical protein
MDRGDVPGRTAGGEGESISRGDCCQDLQRLPFRHTPVTLVSYAQGKLVDERNEAPLSAASRPMTTPAVPGVDPVARAHAALGVALGVVVPEAIALSDGRVRLTGPRDVLSRQAMARLEERLSRRPAEQLSDLRLLTEAIALLGAEIDHARGGSSPVDGATLALDRLLDVPNLAPETEAEAQAMLRGVLEGNAITTPTAARRLAAERAAEQARHRPPLVTDTVVAAREINREVQVLSHRSAVPLPISTGTGRHRRVVGNKHRRGRDRTVGTREVRGAGLAGGRPALEPDEALDAIQQVQPSDLSSRIAAPMQVLDRPRLGVVHPAGRVPQYFRVDVGEPPRGLVAQTKVRAGSIADPHVIRISPRLDSAQLARVWTNQISRTLQEVNAPATARAKTPQTLLARFRSALGGLRGHDRATTAQYDEFRLLSRNWRETQLQPAQVIGGRSVSELERELQSLATAIKKKGRPPPALPWMPGTLLVIAQDRTAPIAPDPTTRLRERVAAEIAGLQQAAAELELRSTVRLASAASASELATKTLEEAATQEGCNDSAAPERARKLRVSAGNTTARAARHTTIATVSQAAANRAKEAGQAYQALLNRLIELEASGQEPGTDVLVLAQTAADQVEDYRVAVAATTPSADVLHTATTSGRMPYLTAIARELNKDLAAANTPFRFTPELLHRRLRAETRRLLSPDGVTLTVPGDAGADVGELTQYNLKLNPGQLKEVLNSPLTFDEVQLGQLEQGGYNVTTTTTQTAGYNGGFNLKTLMAVAPDSSQLKAVSQVVSPGFEFAVAQSHSASGGSQEYGVGGAVELISGEILRYGSTNPSWTWRRRGSAVDQWSQPQVIDSGDPQDAHTLELGIAHSYTVAPPEETIDLAGLGLADQLTEELPEHVASRIDGMDDISDRATAGLRARLGGLDRVGYDQLRGLLIEEAPSRLEESTRPGGIGRIITNGGRAVAYAQVETTVVLESAELLSDSSPEHKVERLRVGFTGATGSQSFSASRSALATLSYSGPGVTDLGTTTADLGPSVKGGRTVSREDSVSTGDNAIHPSVQRTEPTLGVKIRLEHKLTIHRIDREESFVVDGAGDAVLRMPEHDAIRYGFPGPEAALVRTPDGQLRRGTDGRVLLRGDPQPTEDELKLPVYLGNGKDQMRGAGPASIQNFEGADPAFKAFVRHLSAEGLVPPVDANGRPRLAELAGKDPALVASQLANLERVGQQVTRHRMETGYDAACQGGLLLSLSKHHTGRPPEVHTYRMDLQQDFNRVKPLGVTTSQTVVNLDIGSNTTTRSGGRSKLLPWLAKLGLSDKPGRGQAGSTPEIGPSYGRSALGRFFGWATGSTVNRVSLTESTAPVAVFEIPHTFTITEVGPAGDSEPIVQVEGSARVLIDTELLPGDEPPSMAVKGPVDKSVLQAATLQHLDAGNALSRITAALPAAARADSAALHHLAAFVNVRNLVAHPELLETEYRTRLVVSPAPSNPTQAIAQRGLAPRQASVNLRARVKNLRFIGSGHQVVGDINLTLGSSSITAGRSTGNTAGLDGGGGMAAADGDGWGASAGLNRSGSSSSTRTDTTIGGVERLNIMNGQHYQFIGDLVLDAEIKAAGTAQPQKVELEDGTALFSIPEQNALALYGRQKIDLPLSKVSDAVERLLDDNLTLDRRTASSLIRRYQVEKTGIAEGLPAAHTDERLAAKARSLTGMQAPAPGTPERRFEETMADAQKVAAQRFEAHLPAHYRTTMGAGVIVESSLQDAAGQETDVLREVYAAIEERSPDALDDAVLATGLRGDLAGSRWRGHIDDMLDPRGFVKEYPVGEGTEPPRNIRVRIRVVHEGPVTVDEDPDTVGAEGAKPDNAFSIIQNYDYNEQSHSATHSISYGLNAGGALTDGSAGSAGLNTDLGTSTTATTAEQNTRMSRGLWQTKQVERGYRLIVEVEDSAVPDVPPAHRESTGTLAVRVPLSDVHSAPPPPSPEVTDHRTVTLPGDYFLRGTQPFLTGESEVDNLFNAVYGRLGRRDMLTAAGVEMYKTTLENQLSASARLAAFGRIASDDGHPMVRLPVPGHGSRGVFVQVRAEVSGLELVSDPDDDTVVQLGEIDREQQFTQVTNKSNRALPTSQTIGGSDPGTGLKAGVSSGEQATEKDSDSAGGRNETTKLESGPVVTVKVQLDFHLDFERRRLGRRGKEKVDRSDTIRNAATGEAYLTMFRHEYDAMRARMEAGAPPLQNWDPARIRQPSRLPERRVDGYEVVVDGNGKAAHHPYQPMVAALAQARKEQVAVVLTMHRQDGGKEVYRAMPDGTMTSKDDGFAAAFATLHPQLALLAEGQVDLRELYSSAGPNGRFTGAVVAALQREGIPASALTELDHTLSAHHARVSEDGANQQIGRGATGKTGSGMVVQ